MRPVPDEFFRAATSACKPSFAMSRLLLAILAFRASSYGVSADMSACTAFPRLDQGVSRARQTGLKNKVCSVQFEDQLGLIS